MQILDILNENNQLKKLNLSLISADLYENNLLKVVFSCVEDINADTKNLIYSIIKKEVGVYFNIELKFNTPNSNATEIEEFIRNFVSTKIDLTLLKNIIVKVDSKVILLVLSEKIRSELDPDFSNELVNEIQTNYSTQYEIQIKFEEEKEADILNEQKQDFITKALNEQNKLTYVDVEINQNIYGDIDVNKILAIENYNAAKDNVYLAGTITFLNESTTKPKEIDGNMVPGKKFYSFYLNDGNASIRCTIFTNSKNEQYLQILKDGINVVCFGKIDEYNSKLNMLVRNIAICNYTIEEKPKYIAPEPKNYLKVIPQQFIETNQISLFNAFEAISPNEFLKDKTYVVFDLETTGLEFQNDAITEIGAVKIVNGNIVETFSTFVNPQMHIPEKISQITHITDDMVKDAPIIEDVLLDFYKFCYNSGMVAHNIDFDYKFIEYNAKKIGLCFVNKQIDTLLLARNYLKGLKNYKLATVCESLNVELIDAHRAINDCIATAKAFIKLSDFIKE